MKVLFINGSPRLGGNTSIAIDEMVKVFQQDGIDTEVMEIGNLPIRGCIACYSCSKTGKCVFDDAVNKAAVKFEEADALVVATPVYYASANGTLVSFLDRLFCSTSFDKTMKVGASIAVARRGGCSATFDELNKYFTISGMPVVSSTYWNMVHGFTAEHVEKDLEGLQTMRNLGRNMAFLIKAIAAEKARSGLPLEETEDFTCFHQGK